MSFVLIVLLAAAYGCRPTVPKERESWEREDAPSAELAAADPDRSSVTSKGSDRQPSRKNTKIPGVDDNQQPVMLFVGEMEPFATEFTKARPEVSEADVEAFTAAWRRMRGLVSRDITCESLQALSRWAVHETRGFKPLPGWIDTIPMRPLRVSEDNRSILFGQRDAEGLELPSHSPLVFRHLLVCPVYDRKTKAIRTVYVTIRGWAEE